MSKLKVIHKKDRLYVKEKLSKNEQINEREIQVFETKLIRGLMRPSFDGKKTVTYLAPISIELHKYLKNVISKNDFFLIFAQFIETVNKIDKYKLNINNLVLNLKYIFINVMTKEVQFIYQPIMSQNISSNIFSILYDVIFQAKINQNEDLKEINSLIGYLRSMQIFSSMDIQNYISNIYPSVYKQIQKEKMEQSQELNNRIYDVSETSLLYENEGTSLLYDNDEGTTLLQDQFINYPYIIRVKDFERIDINKDTFKLGTDKEVVDYYIDNSAVSRNHADIISNDGVYYVKDNNSTNGTFINGAPINLKGEIQINDGDIITLGNEDFEFHI